MKPAPSETAEFLHRVRQQLILAQVRLMELEDARDELVPKLADAEQLATGAQALADQKLAEADHLAKVLADLQAQYEHMRHMQHVTNEALNQARAEKESVAAALAAAEQRGSQLQKEIVALADQLAQLNTRLSRTGLELAESISTAAARLDRINELDAELRAMKATRSWRWTAWLRPKDSPPGGRQP